MISIPLDACYMRSIWAGNHLSAMALPCPHCGNTRREIYKDGAGQVDLNGIDAPPSSRVSSPSYYSLMADLLPRLLTRHPSNRLSLASLPSHSFFSSLAISTLNFLDPTTFASKPREEKATFLRGLVRVLPTFSERLRKGKVLPSLLEEVSQVGVYRKRRLRSR